jgi:hypothetical protein
MNKSSSLVATLILAVLLAGCSDAATTPTTTSPAAPSSTATSAGTTTAPSSIPPTATVTSPATPSAPAAQATGAAAGIDVTVGAPDSTTLQPGGPAMRSRVTLKNTTANGVARVGMVVSLGHCSCTTGAQLMPAGSLQVLNPVTGQWESAPYVREGGGADFLQRTLVEPFVLEAGQTLTYELELRLDAAQDVEVTAGESAINVTLTNSTTHAALGASPTASLPVTVAP